MFLRSSLVFNGLSRRAGWSSGLMQIRRIPAGLQQLNRFKQTLQFPSWNPADQLGLTIDLGMRKQSSDWIGYKLMKKRNKVISDIDWIDYKFRKEKNLWFKSD